MPDIVSAVAELRGWGVAGGACLMLGPWVLWRSVAVCMVNLLNDLLWGVLRRVWKIFRFVSSMAATREFRDISFAVFIATMVIAAEVFTFGADGILLALRRPVACDDDAGHDGDWEISMSGEDDMCDEGNFSDVGERLEETGKWDEDYYAAPSHSVSIHRRRRARRKVKESDKLGARGFQTQASGASPSPCVATSSAQGFFPTTACSLAPTDVTASSIVLPAAAVSSPLSPSDIVPSSPLQASAACYPVPPPSTVCVGGGPPSGMPCALDPPSRANACVEEAESMAVETAQGEMNVQAPQTTSVPALAGAHAAGAQKVVDVSGFKTASDFADAAFTASANVWERMQRISYLIKALDEEGRNFSDKSVHAADVACEPGAILAYKRAAKAFCCNEVHSVKDQIEYLQELVGEVRRRDDFSDEQRRTLGKTLLDMINERVQPAAPGINPPSIDPGSDQGQGDEGASDAATRVIQKLDADRKWHRDNYARKKREMATGRTKDVRGKKHARTDGNDADDSDGGCDEMDATMEDDDGGGLEGGDGESIDPLEGGSPGSDGEKSGDDVSPPVKETDRQRITRVNDEVKKFGTTLAEVRRLSRCMDTGDYTGFEVRPFKLQPLTNDPNAAHPYSLDEHRELSKCPKCHAPMFKEEHPKQSRCCSKGKVKVLQPNLNLIIEKRRRRERLLAAPNPDERAIAQNNLSEQEEMLWQIHCNPTNVALWIRYGRMINQFFAVARVVASGRIGDAVENKGECVLELHGQTVERVKPIIRDGVHVNNDLYFLLNDPEQKDKAEDEVLERNKVKVKDPNLRRLLDLLEKYLLTYNPLLQQFARQATEVLAERQAVVEVAGEFSPEVHAPEIFLMPWTAPARALRDVNNEDPVKARIRNRDRVRRRTQASDDWELLDPMDGDPLDNSYDNPNDEQVWELGDDEENSYADRHWGEDEMERRWRQVVDQPLWADYVLGSDDDDPYRDIVRVDGLSSDDDDRDAAIRMYDGDDDVDYDGLPYIGDSDATDMDEDAIPTYDADYDSASCGDDRSSGQDDYGDDDRLIDPHAAADDFPYFYSDGDRSSESYIDEFGNHGCEKAKGFVRSGPDFGQATFDYNVAQEFTKEDLVAEAREAVFSSDEVIEGDDEGDNEGGVEGGSDKAAGAGDGDASPRDARDLGRVGEGRGVEGGSATSVDAGGIDAADGDRSVAGAAGVAEPGETVPLQGEMGVSHEQGAAVDGARDVTSTVDDGVDAHEPAVAAATNEPRHTDVDCAATCAREGTAAGNVPELDGILAQVRGVLAASRALLVRLRHVAVGASTRHDPVETLYAKLCASRARGELGGQDRLRFEGGRDGLAGFGPTALAYAEFAVVLLLWSRVHVGASLPIVSDECEQLRAVLERDGDVADVVRRLFAHANSCALVERAPCCGYEECLATASESELDLVDLGVGQGMLAEQMAALLRRGPAPGACVGCREAVPHCVRYSRVGLPASVVFHVRGGADVRECGGGHLPARFDAKVLDVTRGEEVAAVARLRGFVEARGVNRLVFCRAVDAESGQFQVLDAITGDVSLETLRLDALERPVLACVYDVKAPADTGSTCEHEAPAAVSPPRASAEGTRRKSATKWRPLRAERRERLPDPAAGHCSAHGCGACAQFDALMASHGHIRLRADRTRTFSWYENSCHLDAVLEFVWQVLLLLQTPARSGLQFLMCRVPGEPHDWRCDLGLALLRCVLAAAEGQGREMDARRDAVLRVLDKHLPARVAADPDDAFDNMRTLMEHVAAGGPRCSERSCQPQVRSDGGPLELPLLVIDCDERWDIATRLASVCRQHAPDVPVPCALCHQRECVSGRHCDEVPRVLLFGRLNQLPQSAYRGAGLPETMELTLSIGPTRRQVRVTARLFAVVELMGGHCVLLRRPQAGGRWEVVDGIANVEGVSHRDRVDMARLARVTDACCYVVEQCAAERNVGELHGDDGHEAHASAQAAACPPDAESAVVRECFENFMQLQDACEGLALLPRADVASRGPLSAPFELLYTQLCEWQAQSGARDLRCLTFETVGQVGGVGDAGARVALALLTAVWQRAQGSQRDVDAATTIWSVRWRGSSGGADKSRCSFTWD
eukprot:jgi/Mesvir1/22814/Mv15055-RA.1